MADWKHIDKLAHVRITQEEDSETFLVEWSNGCDWVTIIEAPDVESAQKAKSAIMACREAAVFEYDYQLGTGKKQIAHREPMKRLPRLNKYMQVIDEPDIEDNPN